MLRALLRSQAVLRGSKRSISQRQACQSIATQALEAGHESGFALKLRDYQEECIKSVLSYIQHGHKRLGISLATGSGKTVSHSLRQRMSSSANGTQVIFTQLISRISPPNENATQTLILVHRRELVEQAARHCIDAYPSKTVEVEMGNARASGAADITIASIWSIISGDRMLKFDPSQFKLVLVDEAHHIVANSFMETLKHFRLRKEDVTVSSPILVGVSATLSRSDGLRLSDAIDHIVYHKDYVDMIEEKWLANVIFTTVQSRAKLTNVKTLKGGDFQISDLSRAVNTPETNEVTVSSWMARAAKRKSTLVFCVDLTHVSDLTSTFRRHGIDARFITGDTPKRTRGERLDAFKHCEFPVLLNCGVFTEGTDIPNIDCVLLARPTRSRNLLVQMIGRGMRLHPGKGDCHIIDMVASLEAGIVTTPTLLGLDPNSLVQEATVEDIKATRELQELEKVGEQRPKNEPDLSSSKAPGAFDVEVSFTDYKSVYDFINDSSGERYIRGISRLAWVMVGPTRYVLSMPAGSYLTIEGNANDKDDEPSFTVHYTYKMTKELMDASNTTSPFMRPRRIATASTLSDAVHAADTFALQKAPRVMVDASQVWRKRSASEGQVAFINKLRPMTAQLSLDVLTKGKAADMITKIKHGVKGWFAQVEADKRRESRILDRVRQLEDSRRRESVRVGPVRQ